MKRSLLALTIVGTAGIIGLGSVGAVSALTEKSAENDSIAGRIAEKFNIDESEVEAVFEEERTARDTKREATRSERLQELVEDGEITTEQKQLIEAKQDELEASRKQQREELRQWAEENDIDEYLLTGGMMRGHGRMSSSSEMW